MSPQQFVWIVQSNMKPNAKSNKLRESQQQASSVSTAITWCQLWLPPKASYRWFCACQMTTRRAILTEGAAYALSESVSPTPHRWGVVFKTPSHSCLSALNLVCFCRYTFLFFHALIFCCYFYPTKRNEFTGALGKHVMQLAQFSNSKHKSCSYTYNKSIMWACRQWEMLFCLFVCERKSS